MMDDLISRKALLEEFNLWYKCLGGTMNQKNWIVQDTISSAIDIINEAPAVDAEPVRHGEWHREKSIVRCSVCGIGHRDARGGPNIVQFKRCPNCGAKMDGGKDINAPTNEADLY